MSGFVINGVSVGDDSTGITDVSSAGDVNGDGLDDMIIEAPLADRILERIMQEIVLLCSANLFTTAPELSDIVNGNGSF